MTLVISLNGFEEDSSFPYSETQLNTALEQVLRRHLKVDASIDIKNGNQNFVQGCSKTLAVKIIAFAQGWWDTPSAQRWRIANPPSTKDIA